MPEDLKGRRCAHRGDDRQASAPGPASCHPREVRRASRRPVPRAQGAGCPQTRTRMPGSHWGGADKDPALVSKSRADTHAFACLALLSLWGRKFHIAPSDGLFLLLNLLFRRTEPHPSPCRRNAPLGFSSWPPAPRTELGPSGQTWAGGSEARVHVTSSENTQAVVLRERGQCPWQNTPASFVPKDLQPSMSKTEAEPELMTPTMFTYWCFYRRPVPVPLRMTA